MKKVYVSATFKDLEQQRGAVTHALRRMGYQVHCMEDYTATDERTDARCMADVAACDFYVGILAQRYGWIPPGADRSITELEYRQARSSPDRTRCLMFVLEEGADWPLKWVDALTDAAAAAKLTAFKQGLAGESTQTFRGTEDLVHGVMAAVHAEDLKTWQQALRRGFIDLLQECRVTPQGAPVGLENNYKLYLNSSGKEAIIGVLQSAIRSSDKSKLVRIDLGEAGGWWSTRLHLLAGLLADYTNVQKLVFCEQGRHLGTCGPAETRRALANAYPEVEQAFAAALPARRDFDPQEDIRGIVTRFTEALDQRGGEATVKRDIRSHIVREFRDFSDNRVRFVAGQDELEQQRDVLGRPEEFVALEDQQRDVTIVDRVQLATRVAQLAMARV